MGLEGSGGEGAGRSGGLPASPGYYRYAWLDRIERSLGTTLSDNARWRLQAVIVGVILALSAISIAEAVPWILDL